MISFIYTVELNQGGGMNITHHHGMDNIYRENYYQLKEDEINVLKAELSSLSKIKLKDIYLPGEDVDIPTDIPTTIYQYRYNSQADSTQLYFVSEEDLPEELNSFTELLGHIIKEYDTL